MTNYQKALVASYEKMLIECKNDPESVAKIPVFGKKMDRVSEILTEIKTLAPEQEAILTGITKEKNDLVNTLRDYLYDITGAIHSYAVDTKDKPLADKTDYNRDDIVKIDLKGLEILGDSMSAELAKIKASDLEEYGLLAEEIADYTDTLALTKNNVNNTDIAQIDKSAVKIKIQNLFAELADIKKKSIIKLLRQFERKAPEFHFKFKAAMTLHYSTRKSTKTTTETTPAS